uniref:LIM domain-binding protein 2-like isoform X3 n=1 Tax=Myxine glutinosa TaxID=7769 RepID=UPI00358EA5B4
MLDREPGPFPPSYMEPDVGRHTPYVIQPEYRLHELNKRLQARTEESDNLWWDAFATEFFDDDASFTLAFCLEDGPKRYTIGRTLIPRYFRTIFEGGVTDLSYMLRHSKEAFNSHSNAVTLDCEHCTMVTHHGKPAFTTVCTDGRLILEFSVDEMRIRTWHFSIRQHRELLPRSLVAIHTQDPQSLEQLSKNVTRSGQTNVTLNYLRLCVILEPMQELMSRHKTYNLSPRDCLKTCLFQKWQRMVAPPAEPTRQQTSKRRKRKPSSGSTATANNTGNKKKSPSSNFSLGSQVPGGTGCLQPDSRVRPGMGCVHPVPQDVMVVGEPTLMGGEFGDEDERLITRLENTQYDAGAAAAAAGAANGLATDDEDFAGSPALGGGSPWAGKPPGAEAKAEGHVQQVAQ